MRFEKQDRRLGPPEPVEGVHWKASTVDYRQWSMNGSMLPWQLMQLPQRGETARAEITHCGVTLRKPANSVQSLRPALPYATVTFQLLCVLGFSMPYVLYGTGEIVCM